MGPEAVEAPQILFEDTHLIVLSKPAGLLSQGEESGAENLVDWLRKYVGRNYIGLIHRLDRNTSGIMIAAKRTKAARRLTEALQNGELKRTYLAWLNGRLSQTAVWEHWIRKDADANTSRVVKAGQPGAKEAVLKVTPVQHGQYAGHSVTLGLFELQTGRSHQIRVQSAAEKLPVIGDPKYGKAFRQVIFKRPALHSSTLEFPHPMSGEVMKCTAPLPEDFIRFSQQVKS